MGTAFIADPPKNLSPVVATIIIVKMPDASDIRPLSRHERTPAWRTVVTMAMFPFWELLTNSLVTLVDVILAGKLLTGADIAPATAAAGAGGMILWLLALLQQALGVGATALVSRSVGAGNRREASRFVGQSMAASVLWGVILTGILLLGAPVLASLTGLEGRALEYASLYLRITGMFIAARSIMFVGAACLRADGDMRTPFAVMLVVNIVNASASILFVAHWSPIGGHGFAGIAAGTGVAWCTGAAFTLWALVYRKREPRLRMSDLAPSRDVTARLARVALPNCLEGIGMWIGQFSALAILGHFFHDMGMAAHMIALRTQNLCIVPVMAIGIAMATLTGQSLGHKDEQEARERIRSAISIAAILMAVLGALLFIFADQLVAFMTNDPHLRSTSPSLLRLIAFTQFPYAVYVILSRSLQGAGDTRFCAILTFLFVFAVQLPLVYVLGTKTSLGLWGVWLAYSIERVASCSLFVWRYRQDGWARIAV